MPTTKDDPALKRCTSVEKSCRRGTRPPHPSGHQPLNTERLGTKSPHHLLRPLMGRHVADTQRPRFPRRNSTLSHAERRGTPVLFARPLETFAEELAQYGTPHHHRDESALPSRAARRGRAATRFRWRLAAGSTCGGISLGLGRARLEPSATRRRISCWASRLSHRLSQGDEAAGPNLTSDRGWAASSRCPLGPWG